MSELPDGWAEATLGEVVRLRGEKATPATVPHLPFLGLEDVEAHTSRIIKYVPATDVRSAGARFSAGEILYSRLRPYLNKVVTAAVEGLASAEFLVLHPELDIQGEFIRRRIMAEDFLAFAALLDRGDRPRVNFEQIAEFPILLPPAPEQRRIVAKLDALLAGVARARKELDRVPILIAHHKQALLAAAFSGELTREWREARGVSLDSWTVTTLGELVDDGPSNGWSPPSSGSSTGALSLKLTATTSGALRLDENAVKRIDETPPPDSKFWLRPGDVLIQRANSLEHVGACAVFEGPENTYIYPDLMMRVRVNDAATRRYLWRFLNSEHARAYFRANATGSAGNMPKINGGTVRALKMPLPPSEELAAIVAALDGAFGWLEGAAVENARAARLLPKLGQAILAKSFRGELVPQDPADEPASVLLDRIRAERSAGRRPARQGNR